MGEGRRRWIRREGTGEREGGRLNGERGGGGVKERGRVMCASETVEKSSTVNRTEAIVDSPVNCKAEEHLRIATSACYTKQDGSGGGIAERGVL